MKTAVMSALALLWAAGAGAAEADSRPAWGLEMDGGWAAMALGDVNQGASQDIEGGEQAGLGLEWRPMGWLALDARVGYLMAQDRTTTRSCMFYDPLAGGAPEAWNYTQHERYSALETGVQAWLERPLGAFDLRVGLGVAWANLAGSEISNNAPSQMPGLSESLLLYGSAPDCTLGAGADWWVDRHFSLGVQGGWRWCDVREVTLAGAESGTWKNADGSDRSIDFSGWNLGVRGVFWF
jgi:hypothetical protein